MKKTNHYFSQIKMPQLFFSLRLFLALVMVALLTLPITVKAEGEEESEVKTEKPTVNFELQYFREDGQSKVKIKASAEIKDEEQPVENLVVNIYLNQISRLRMMGSIVTNADGEGTVIMGKRFENVKDSFEEYNFIASAGSDPRFELSQGELKVGNATLALNVATTDSGKYMIAKLFQKVNGIETPIPEQELHFYAKRFFSLLPVDNEGETPPNLTTDENGTVTIKFPDDIPGDTKGNLVAVVRLEDADPYANLMTTQTVKWGIPLKIDHEAEARALWATRENTPIWLLVFVNAMIAGVWLTILYVVIGMFRIKKIGKKATNLNQSEYSYENVSSI